MIRVYKDGSVQRFLGTATVPPGLDPRTGVESKDVTISDHVSARLYLLPNLNEQKKSKIPLLVYFHGGGFCIESAASPTYHNHLNLLASQAGLVVVSVEYRRAPEHPLPAAFDDSWAALQWVQSHAVLAGKEPWLLSHVDFSRVFLGGDSAGATIAHHVGIKAGVEGLAGIRLDGFILVHPFFDGEEVIPGEKKMTTGSAFWRLICPESKAGLDDPWINPALDPNLKLMATERLLVMVAEKDFLRARGLLYKETVANSGWQGHLQLVETEGQGHVFHLLNPNTDAAATLLHQLVLFINHHPPLSSA